MNPLIITDANVRINHGMADLEVTDSDGTQSVIATCFSDEEEYHSMCALSARCKGMTVADAQKAWHNECVRLIRASVTA